MLPNPATAGASVQLSDSDGFVIAYLWTSDVVGELGTSEDLAISTLPVGTHNISYAAQDDDLDWATAAVAQFLVEVPPNQPPTATILSVLPSPAIVEQPVTLDGDAMDSDGLIVEHRWTSSLDGVIGNTEDLSLASLSLVTHSLTYEVRDDDDTWSEPALENLEVQLPPNEPPVAVIVSVTPNPAIEGETIQFNGSSDDSDGTVVSYHWVSNQDGSLSTEEDFSTASLSIGQHTITFVVEDDDGDASPAAALLLEVTEVPNVPPTASIDRISPTAAFKGDPISFEGSGSDSDGTITNYVWESDRDGNLSTDQNFSTPALTPGTHVISLMVKDDDGDWSVEVTDTVQISEIPNQAPTAQILSLTPNPAEVATPVNFDGDGLDSDGNIAAYSWESDRDGSLSDEEDFTTSSLSVGVHVVSLRVRDNDSEWSAKVTRSLEIHPPANTVLTLVAPGDAGSLPPPTANRQVMVDDPEGETVDLTFFGRHASLGGATESGEEFTIVVLPDTQNYLRNGGTYVAYYEDQVEWIVDNVETEKIAFVSHVGNVVSVADNVMEWDFADTIMAGLEGVVPYGISPGNHDQDLHLDLETSNGNLYPEYFPPSRFEGFSWYGGNFPPGTNWNNYQLFSAGDWTSSSYTFSSVPPLKRSPGATPCLQPTQTASQW